MSPRYDIPKLAPEPLRLVQRFVNTVDRHHGREWLAAPGDLTAWFAEAGWPVDDVGPAELRRAVELREALHSLASANTWAGRDPGAVAVVNDAARRAGLTPALAQTGGISFECTGPGFDGAVCRVLAIAFESMIDGSWARLKACPECRWVFYDYSRNRSASWCSMRICGNRAKARAFRQRRAEGARS